MAVISMKQLLEAGVHFGHQTRRWNPKMDKYIFTERNGIYIIDLQKTVKKVDEAYEFVKSVADQGGKMLFVGTKKQAQDAIKEEAERSGQYYINHRWLGGTLTNYKTIKGRIDRIAEIEKMEADGVFEVLPKKEVIELRKEYDKLNKFLGGIREMKGMPDAIFVVDPKKEHNAIAEAKKLGIPVVGIVDTNCDPDDVDYVIPANDDAIRAVKLLTAKMADAFVAFQWQSLALFPPEFRYPDAESACLLRHLMATTKILFHREDKRWVHLANDGIKVRSVFLCFFVQQRLAKSQNKCARFLRHKLQ